MQKIFSIYTSCPLLLLRWTSFWSWRIFLHFPSMSWTWPVFLACITAWSSSSWRAWSSLPQGSPNTPGGPGSYAVTTVVPSLWVRGWDYAVVGQTAYWMTEFSLRLLALGFHTIRVHAPGATESATVRNDFICLACTSPLREDVKFRVLGGAWEKALAISSSTFYALYIRAMWYGHRINNFFKNTNE